jgi:hypothetical protein
MPHDYSNRHWLIIPTEQLSAVDFSEVLESISSRTKDPISDEVTSVSYTCTQSADGTKSLIKWEGDTPAFVNSLTNTLGPYNHSEIIEILDTVNWGL